jgi:NCK-associated protein 1
MVALDLDASLKGLFQHIVQHLESIPKLQGENISAIMCDLSVRNLCKSSSICYGEVF